MQYMRLDPPSRAALLAELAAMPGFLRDTFAGLAADARLRRGPGGEFAPVEQVWHLADLEDEGFGYRIDRLLNTPEPALPDFDGSAVAEARNYRALSLEAGLEKFARARAANLRALGAVGDEAWSRSGTQEGVGPVTLCDMPLFLAQHDRAHKAEIEAWLASDRESLR